MEFGESFYIESKENFNLIFVELEVINVGRVVLCRRGICYIEGGKKY